MEVFLKLVGLFLSVASIVNNTVVVYGKEIFYVVSPSTGSENFYLKLKRLEAKKDTESQLREDIICEAILKSPFFSTDNQVELVDPVDEQKAYAQFDPEMNWHMFRKPYKAAKVSVLQNVTQEAVFPCVARTKSTNEMKLYLVSHEYYFNVWIKRRTPTKCPSVRGRFIFEYNKSKKLAYLSAVAEEPACRLGYYADTYHSVHYLSVQSDLKAISKRGRAICNFTTGRKIRICAVGLNAEKYRREVTFSPLEDKIDPQCEKKDLIYNQLYAEFKFSEWVIGCKAETIGKRYGTTYYMSLGYEPYQFLIYHPEEGKNSSKLIHDFYTHLGMDNSN